MSEEPGNVVVASRIEPAELARLAKRFFGDMVKIVVDIRRNIAAVGGELHADAEQLLIEGGSRQEDLWGANYYPGVGPAQCVETTALINIRPSQGNNGMDIEDEEIREAVSRVIFSLVGRGEAI